MREEKSPPLHGLNSLLSEKIPTGSFYRNYAAVLVDLELQKASRGGVRNASSRCLKVR